MNLIKQLCLTCLIMIISNHACAQFSDETQIINSHQGTGFFGWAVSELKDINNDSVTDYIIGSTGSDNTSVFSGADGSLLFNLKVENTTIGYAVADAGDVDGDGTHDIIAGGPTANSSAGVSVIFSGKTGQKLWQFNGEQAGDRMGTSVSSAGDINADGKADVLVGAAGYDNSGRVYIYSGMTGQIIRTLEAESQEDLFGGGVALLSDLNNDQVNDHIVGAHDAGPTKGGKAYVFSGLSGDLLFELNPDQGASQFGQFFVANANDVNNDGFGDIYVGDYNHNSGVGRSYIFSGKDQQVIHRFSGSGTEGTGPGRSAGDINNDGYHDIIVGSYTGGNNQSGVVRVFSGKNGEILQSFTHIIASAQLGFDAVGIGDVNNDGRNDFLVSAAQGNAVYVLAGKVTPHSDQAAVKINVGMNGAWYNPETPGQGVFIDVYPTIQSMFLGYFTFELSNDLVTDSAVLGDSNHRWVTAFGHFQNNTANLDISLTQQGAFNTSNQVTTTPYGVITLEFSDCSNATLKYNFSHIGINGMIPLTRIVSDNVQLCDALSD